MLVGFGGFFGAVSRFSVYRVLSSYSSLGFPVATLLVNILGCFSAGLVFEYLREHAHYQTISLLFVVGFMGSFTTFSAFGFETFHFIRSNEMKLAAFNIVGNLALCLMAVGAGGWLGHNLK